jgi:radical SAM superfamily enzyme YgiQ (UPF0313 family)
MDVRLVETFVADGAALLAKKILEAIDDGGVAKGLAEGLAKGPAQDPAADRAVGFSLYSWNRSICVEAAAIIRERHPGVFLFCGGPDAGAVSGGPFDKVIRGEGEQAAAALLGRRFFGRTVAADNPEVFADLASLPSPWLDGTLDPADRPGILWELTRGCPYACAYCFESKGRVRYIPEERLRKELKVFAQSVPASSVGKYVFILDPTFNTDNKRALRILDLIEEEATDLPIHWHFEARAELLTREQAKRFARLEASLQIGLQSSNPEVAARIGRGFDPKVFTKKIGLLNQEGVSFGLDLIYGLPGDNLAGYKRSLDYSLSLYPDNLDLFHLALLPGTALADRAAEFGLNADSDAPYLVRGTPDFPEADLEHAEKLSWGAGLFYNTGRAVAWFNQALHPLRMRPSVFLEEFAAWAVESLAGQLNAGDALEDLSSKDAEKLQLAFLEKLYTRKKKVKLLPALRDIVTYHGAWGRALVEGLTTELHFNYDPRLVLSEEALDLERFVEMARPKPTRVQVSAEAPLRFLPR